ncbi:MAG: extracellular solute-binding protein [Chloroflexi bacterium CSP1-4]|nr:MAG: extracellular solute-binding protein [Chloroflexi bacterium CSP1-4]
MNPKLRLAALVAGLAIVASACAAGASPTPEPAAPTVAPTAAPPAGPTEPATLSGALTIWHAYGSSGGRAEFNAFSRILEKVQAANPGLTITAVEQPFSDIFTKFETASAAGGGPDMFIAPNDNLGNEVRGNFLVDLTGKIDDVLANTNEVSVSGSQVDGKVYMVPESLKAVAMYYDTAKVPTPPKTTAELLAFVQGGGKVGILSGAYFGWGFYFGFGGKIFNDDGSCAATANSGVADGIKFVADLKAAGALVDADYNKVNDAFKSGKIDIILNGNWTLGDYRTARPAAAVAPVPAGPGGPSSTMVGVDGWYINASSKNQDLAIAVATELVSQASQEIYVDVAGHVPSNTGISIVDPLVKSFSDAINLGVARPQSKEFGNYWGNFGNAWDEVLLKGGDATAAVAKGCTDMDVANGH